MKKKKAGCLTPFPWLSGSLVGCSHRRTQCTSPGGYTREHQRVGLFSAEGRGAGFVPRNTPGYKHESSCLQHEDTEQETGNSRPGRTSRLKMGALDTNFSLTTLRLFLFFWCTSQPASYCWLLVHTYFNQELALRKTWQNSPLGYWWEVDQSPTEAKPYSTLPSWDGPELRADACHQHAVPSRGNLGRLCFRFVMGKFSFFFEKKSYYGGGSGIAPHRITSFLLPFDKASYTVYMFQSDLTECPLMWWFTITVVSLPSLCTNEHPSFSLGGHLHYTPPPSPILYRWGWCRLATPL